MAALAGLALLAASAQAHALTMAECNTKFNAAKDTGTLGSMTWNAFRKSECAPGAAPAPVQQQPIDALKAELKQAGASEHDLLLAFTALSLGPIAKQCVDDGFEDASVADELKAGFQKSGVHMTEDQVNRYYEIDKNPGVELFTYKGLSDDNRYEFCQSKRGLYAAFEQLAQ